MAEPAIAVEYDQTYYGGNYDDVGDVAYVPVSLIVFMEKLGFRGDDAVERAFIEHTGIGREHIVHYGNEPTTDYDETGEGATCAVGGEVANGPLVSSFVGSVHESRGLDAENDGGLVF